MLAGVETGVLGFARGQGGRRAPTPPPIMHSPSTSAESLPTHSATLF
jgi:hypothetical protein